MKKLRFLSMAIALVILVGGVSSCKKKKDDPKTDPVVVNHFTGTWQYVEMATTAKSSDPTLKSTTFTYTFTADKKYTYKEFETYTDNTTKDTNSYSDTYEYTETAITFKGKTYQLSEDKKTLKINGSDFKKI